MVEAIVVMCVMMVFLGRNVWAFKAYGGKIDQMSSTRRDALFYASHSCERALGEDPDDYTVPELRTTRGSRARVGSPSTSRARRSATPLASTASPDASTRRTAKDDILMTVVSHVENKKTVTAFGIAGVPEREARH